MFGVASQLQKMPLDKCWKKQKLWKNYLSSYTRILQKESFRTLILISNI